MRKKIYYILLGVVFLSSNYNFQHAFQTAAPHIITFFIRPLWEQTALNAKDLKKISQSLSSSDKFNKFTCSLINNEHKKCRFYSGIIAAHGGFTAISDNTGQIILPRYVATPELTIVVTQSLKPIPEALAPNTIHHWQIINPDKAAYYKADLIQDTETELYHWHISTTKQYKDNLIVPRDALIIFANPKHIIIPTGTITNPNNVKLNQTATNLVLPDFYSTQNIESVINSMRFLKLRKFFEPIAQEYKFYPDRSAYTQKTVDL